MCKVKSHVRILHITYILHTYYTLVRYPLPLQRAYKFIYEQTASYQEWELYFNVFPSHGRVQGYIVTESFVQIGFALFAKLIASTYT